MDKIKDFMGMIEMAQQAAAKYKTYYLSYTAIKKSVYEMVETFKELDEVEDPGIKQQIDIIFNKIENG